MAKGLTELKEEDPFTREEAISPDLQLVLATPRFDQTPISEVVTPLSIIENVENEEDDAP